MICADFNKIRSVLFDLVGPQEVILTAITNAELTGGKSCPFLGVKKKSVVNGLINFNYEDSVNDQRSQEGLSENFIAGARSFGSRLYRFINGERVNIPFVYKAVIEDGIDEDKFWDFLDSELYLEMKVEKVLEESYFYDDAIGNIPVNYIDVKKWLRHRKINPNQELESPVVLKDYSLTNIRSINVMGEEYSLIKE